MVFIALIVVSLVLPGVEASVNGSQSVEPVLPMTLIPFYNIEFYVLLSGYSQVILPNIVGKPMVGSNPAGNALATDWTAAGYFAGLAESSVVRYDTDLTYVDNNGNPTAGAGFGLMLFGGQSVNRAVWHYEQGVAVSPIYPGYDASNVWFVQRGVGQVSGSTVSWSDVTSGNRGMILLEFFEDAAGRYVLIVYGFSWYDTFGGALFFHRVMFIGANLQAYTKSWYIVERIDNGNGDVDYPGVDTYNVVASGP